MEKCACCGSTKGPFTRDATNELLCAACAPENEEKN